MAPTPLHANVFFMKLVHFLSLGLFISMGSLAQPNVSIIPQPNQLIAGKGSFLLNKEVIIVSGDGNLLGQAILLNKMLEELAGFKLQMEIGSATVNPAIVLEKKEMPGKKPGSYEMSIQKKQVKITGCDDAGIFYGLNNIIQLLPGSAKKENGFSLPLMEIKDEPRFTYRGMMLDVARHYRSIEYIKKLLDQLAMLKLNVFHWHLTEDQGWRIEIKKYPRLTQVGAWRNGTIIGNYPGTGNDNEVHGGFYTQEQVKEIVQYASERHITVVPEIEMPGHSGAAIAAYPYLSCFPNEETIIPKHPSEKSKAFKGKKVQESWGVYEDVFVPSEQTFKFLEDVINEIIPLFPGKYIHIGGDECPKEAWKRSAFCQELIREKGLKDEHGLQSYFIGRMEKYINSKGKQIIGWDEILEGGLAPNATVMSWRGEEGGIEAAKQRHDVVMTPTNYAYLDYSQSKNEDSIVIGGYLPLEKVYSYNPMPEALQGTEYEQYVMGAQANVWTEYIKHDSKLEYMIFPRLAAMSEAIWTRPDKKNLAFFESKLPAYFSMLDKLGIQYSHAFYGLKPDIKPNKNNDGVVWSLSTKMPDAAIYFIEPGKDNNRKYYKPLNITTSGTYIASIYKGDNLQEEIEQTFTLHKAIGRPITLKNPSAQKYPGNGGSFGMLNGVISDNGLQSAEWFGWEGGDMEAVIDLGNAMQISTVGVAVFESKGSWIYRPSHFEVYVSNDNKNFTLAGKGKTDELTADELPRKLTCDFSGSNATARYVKVLLKNYGMIPSGLPGAGHKAWLFVDEIEIN